VNKSLGKLFITTRGDAMKRIVMYCGALLDDESVRVTGEVYVRNAPEYLDMTNEERVVVLTGLIAELSQELDFVVKQLNAQETSSEALSLAQ
jgi:hypothetical protein